MGVDGDVPGRGGGRVLLERIGTGLTSPPAGGVNDQHHETTFPTVPVNYA